MNGTDGKAWEFFFALRCLVKQPLMGLCSHSQPPLVQTQTVTITAASLPSDISTTEVPIVPTKTFTYEPSKVGALAHDLSELSGRRVCTEEPAADTEQRGWEGDDHVRGRHYCSFLNGRSDFQYFKKDY